VFGCWLCGQLYNDLVTIWGLGLFSVVFGLWLWDDFSVIIRGRNIDWIGNGICNEC
jgi:hypothetical protein